jgi:hypothetical protein
MAIKAALKIVLHAGDTVVADSDDPALWHRVLAAIHEEPLIGDIGGDTADVDPPPDPAPPEPPRAPVDPDVVRFADELNLATDAVQRACSPSKQPPYLHLDRAAWQAMKDATPPRGPGSLPRAAVAATLLALWFRRAELGSPTVKMVHKVLRTIDVRDKNAARVVREARWLHARGRTIALTADASRAITLAKAFCAHDWTGHRRR